MGTEMGPEGGRGLGLSPCGKKESSRKKEQKNEN